MPLGTVARGLRVDMARGDRGEGGTDTDAIGRRSRRLPARGSRRLFKPRKGGKTRRNGQVRDVARHAEKVPARFYRTMEGKSMAISRIMGADCEHEKH